MAWQFYVLAATLVYVLILATVIGLAMNHKTRHYLKERAMLMRDRYAKNSEYYDAVKPELDKMTMNQVKGDVIFFIQLAHRVFNRYGEHIKYLI